MLVNYLTYKQDRPYTKMIIKSADFITSAVKPDQYPPAEGPEIAFAGRSNVGKSSLINCLVNRKRLVKTSSTPGRTQLINFFRINATFNLVDLPGYGYARVPEKVRRQWGPMVERYLDSRTTLKGVVLLIDVRRTPGAEEGNLLNWLLDRQLPCLPVLTKADKLSKTKQRKQALIIAAHLDIAAEDLILFSAKTRQGKNKVWAAIEELVLPAGQDRHHPMLKDAP
jgi:GTP-binding protein